MSRLLVRLSALFLLMVGCVLATASAQEAPAAGSPWPAQVNTADGQVSIFQPQLVDFQNDVLSERAAVSVQLNGQQDPIFGAVWLQHHVSVDQASRKIQIVDTSVTRSRFPNSDPALDHAVADGIGQYFGGRNIVLSLDQVQTMLDTVHKEQTAATQVQTDAPKIVFLDHPAVKLQYDGTPRLTQVDNSPLLRAVNTPFFVALDPQSRTYFLKGGGAWFAAPDPMGPFHHVAAVPDSIAALAAASGYQDPQQPLPPEQVNAVEIVTATDPTELVWTNGPAQLSTIAGTGLLYVANTGSDVFMTIDNQQYYLLLSGRWYNAPGRQGPWAFVSPEQLPDDFRHIPADSEKAGVLVSVPGSAAAAGAVADAFIPQTAAIDTSHFDQPPVTYDGDPNFQPIEGTDMTYAVNSGASVVFVHGRYYACHEAVWYLADSAAGPWQLCTSVPGEIYTIPPSCPVYPVRFVYVYGRHGGAIYYGYLPGYLGSYVYDGVVVYGTGYHYHPWIGHEYLARPDTFGYAAHYDFYTGHWGFDFGIALGGGFDLVAVGGNDHFHHDVWFGHGGFHPVYARDVRHVEVARAAFAVDAQRHPAVVVNVFARRADVHLELPHSSIAPRAEVRIDVAGARRPAPAAARPAERAAPAVRDEPRNTGRTERAAPPESARPGTAVGSGSVDKASPPRTDEPARERPQTPREPDAPSRQRPAPGEPSGPAAGQQPGRERPDAPAPGQGRPPQKKEPPKKQPDQPQP